MIRPSPAVLSSICCTILCIACGSSPNTIGGEASNSGTGSNGITTYALGAGGVAGTSSGAGGSQPVTTSPDGTCGSTTANTTRAQADILIVLDNTSSMQQSMTDDTQCGARGATCTSRQAVVVPAVQDVVTNNPGVNWGLQLLTAGNCQVYSKPQVAVAANTAGAITSALAALQQSSSTPTASALKSAAAYLKSVTDGNSKAILLATDGEPNCLGGSTSGTDLDGASAAASEASKAGFPVYVIGIGPSLSNLTALAKAGGTNDYYPATSPEQLSSALASITKVVSATCTFKANSTPPDKTLVYVYVDKKLVNKSDSAGWKFDANDASGATVTLTGSYCTDMMSGKTTQVQIVFGCPNVAPPGTIL